MKKYIVYSILLLANCKIENTKDNSTQSEKKEIFDGPYCADIEYFNENTNTESAYRLIIDVENNYLKLIKFPQGWLDEDEFGEIELDETGFADFETTPGHFYTVQINDRNVKDCFENLRKPKQCLGVTKSGERCQKLTDNLDGLCWNHSYQYDNLELIENETDYESKYDSEQEVVEYIGKTENDIIPLIRYYINPFKLNSNINFYEELNGYYIFDYSDNFTEQSNFYPKIGDTCHFKIENIEEIKLDGNKYKFYFLSNTTAGYESINGNRTLTSNTCHACIGFLSIFRLKWVDQKWELDEFVKLYKIGIDDFGMVAMPRLIYLNSKYVLFESKTVSGGQGCFNSFIELGNPLDFQKFMRLSLPSCEISNPDIPVEKFEYAIMNNNPCISFKKYNDHQINLINLSSLW